ncbi:uncharacterized protein LOC143149927 [Ptiloglossa arizonensis]|uniref:uncharacterized protein LOC143149927 n=1 Tax=Ptiloglossa arizonensis TaxID=3350558 RepID=UPI003F9F1AF4
MRLAISSRISVDHSLPASGQKYRPYEITMVLERPLRSRAAILGITFHGTIKVDKDCTLTVPTTRNQEYFQSNGQERSNEAWILYVLRLVIAQREWKKRREGKKTNYKNSEFAADHLVIGTIVVYRAQSLFEIRNYYGSSPALNFQ